MVRLKPFLLSMLISGISCSIIAQVEIDQSIQLTGGTGLSSISGIVDPPVNGTDAVNKDYVDNAVAATGGGGMPTTLSNESGLSMHLGDAIRYCRNLTEDGFTDWRLPNYTEFISAASTDDTVNSDTSANYCHIGAADGGSYSLGTNSGATNYNHLAIRLSDGARSNDFTNPNPNYYVRCVR